MPIRNFVHRRNHKERSQPTHRAKRFGLLEKHKDYVQRARDHHSKRDRIKRLREKALERNKDEFYFAMVKGKTDRGVHIQSRGNEPLPVSVVSLLKTQDVGYVRRQITQERKRIEALVAQVAPNVPEMRVEWLQEKDSRSMALREAGLLGLNMGNKVESAMEMHQGRGEGKVGSQGKRTLWLDGVAQVRAYSKSTSKPSTTATILDDFDKGNKVKSENRSIEDYDLQDIDEDVLLDQGELTDSDDDDDESDASDLEPVHSSSSSSAEKRLGQLRRREEEHRRSMEKHWSYLLSLLRARQIRLEALLSASSRLHLVRSLMSNKGGTSVSKHRADENAEVKKIKEAVANGKMTKNGLAMPGNEDDDDQGEDEINGSSKGGKRDKIVYKFGKERKR